MQPFWSQIKVQLIIIASLPIAVPFFYKKNLNAPCTGFTNSCGAWEKCVDGRCKCNILTTQTRYTSNGEARCQAIIYYGNSKIKCPSGSVKSISGGDNCYKVNYQKPMDVCNITGEIAYLCNPEDFIQCESKKCMCFNDYKYNFDNKTCFKATRKSYVTEYCRKQSDCSEGLQCSTSKYRCICPSPCKYLNEKGLCDCGKVTFSPSKGVIILGVFLSAASIIFWCHIIYKTGKRQKRESFEQLAAENTPSTADLPLTPLTEPTDKLSDEPPSYADAVSPILGFSVPEKSESEDLPTYADLPKTSIESDNCPNETPFPIHPNPTAPNKTSEIYTPHFPIAPTTGSLTDLHSSNTEMFGTQQIYDKSTNDLPSPVNPPK